MAKEAMNRGIEVDIASGMAIEEMCYARVRMITGLFYRLPLCFMKKVDGGGHFSVVSDYSPT